MSNKLFVLSFLVIILVSCNNKRKQESPKKEIPKALEVNKSSIEIRYLKSYDDLIESLYSELVNKNMDLKEVEERIDKLKSSKKDSIDVFDNFINKNQSYFSSANSQIEGISDSVLRNRMRNLIEGNMTKYNSSIVKHNELLKMIETNNLTVSDLHRILKIVRTLPLMEEYQKENLPGTNSLEGYINRQDEAIKLAETLSNK